MCLRGTKGAPEARLAHDTGLTLWADFIAPLVAIALYALWRRAAPGRAATPSPT
jgi:hypothetical protein